MFLNISGVNSNRSFGSEKPFRWIIFICLHNVVFPESPVPIIIIISVIIIIIIIIAIINTLQFSILCYLREMFSRIGYMGKGHEGGLLLL